jgi:hypothetical protein
VPKYLVSEWSYAQVRGLEGKAICAFDRDAARIIVSASVGRNSHRALVIVEVCVHVIQVICSNGTFLTSSYEHGGECERLTYAKFVKSEAEAEAAAAVQPWTAGGSTGALTPAQYAAAQGGAGLGGPLDGSGTNASGGGTGASSGLGGDAAVASSGGSGSAGIGTTGGANGGSVANNRGLSFAPDDDGR